ncbi:prepilin peptidase [Vibrio tubiashii]|uniref:A24 family peptidase n=1 Tax=Vibrio tubiashii TaxID=29498 RepID=UPI00349EF30F
MSHSLVWLYLLATLSLVPIISDLRYRKISNVVCLGMLILSAIVAVQVEVQLQILNVISFVFIGFILQITNWLGGGDSKLLAAYSVAISPENIPVTLFVIAILGGVLSAIYLVKNKLTNKPTTGIPYGIAITIGGLFGVMASI